MAEVRAGRRRRRRRRRLLVVELRLSLRLLPRGRQPQAQRQARPLAPLRLSMDNGGS